MKSSWKDITKETLLVLFRFFTTIVPRSFKIFKDLIRLFSNIWSDSWHCLTTYRLMKSEIQTWKIVLISECWLEKFFRYLLHGMHKVMLNLPLPAQAGVIPYKCVMNILKKISKKMFLQGKNTFYVTFFKISNRVTKGQALEESLFSNFDEWNWFYSPWNAF